MDEQSAITAAHAAMERDAFEEAETILLPIAQSASVEAQSLLGTVYQIRGDFSAAILWLRKAAEAGNGCAAHNLGVVYLMSDPPNHAEGHKWLQVAYDAGFEAQVASDPLWFKK